MMMVVMEENRSTGLDADACYRAVRSRDRRFDGVFYTAVRTTGIYCRPSCPARTPARENVTFHRDPAAAQAGGYRACKRCRPDAVPGSPQWDVAADVAGRAMRLIADGVVDREGVPGLARRLGYTERHLTRLLTTELGAGPLALARARRARTARALVETTDLDLADVAFAAGFGSVRQFNATVREVYDLTPGALRARATRTETTAPGWLRLRVAVRTPFAGCALRDFLAHHLVPGVEIVDAGGYARTLDLPHGPGTVRISLPDLPGTAGGTSHLTADLHLTDLRDVGTAWERTRRLVDADCDPIAVDDALAADPILGPQVAAVPGLRLPGQVDGAETALRTVLGQQVSVVGARTLAGRLVAAHGVPVATAVPGLTHLFPRPAALAGLSPEDLPMPRARGAALLGLAATLAAGDLRLDRGEDRDDVRARLLALRGIGPWTADYILMRALAHPDVFLPTDLAVRQLLTARGWAEADIAAGAARWAPWRSYALMRLWQPLMPAAPDPDPPTPRPEVTR